ncbi:MAG: hypothetical protein IAG10_22910, partial [Planctomycetaceae bacterium]|nr:hypothetical protein [Planctomycetaceae bacterium]
NMVDIEAKSFRFDKKIEAFLHKLADDLRTSRYRPGPVRRFEIPKPNNPSKTRPIVVLTLADRIVHTALKLLLEPLVEARLAKSCFGFRPGRSRYDQMFAVRRLVEHESPRFTAALATDIASCFDQLDHAAIRRELRQVTSDGELLQLLEQVLLQVGQGQTGWWRKRRVGILQGSALSPLLANLTLATFDREWSRKHATTAPAFRYADDLLILAQDIAEGQLLQKQLVRCLWETNRLELAEDKTHVVTFQAGVPLLGMQLQEQHGPFDDESHVRILWDVLKVRACLTSIDEWAQSLTANRSLGRQFAEINRRLWGWFATYQYAFNAPQAFEAIDRRVFQATRARLKVILSNSSTKIAAEHHVRLRSGHESWQCDGEVLLVLSSLARKAYCPKRQRLPWDMKLRDPREFSASTPSPESLVMPSSPSLE